MNKKKSSKIKKLFGWKGFDKDFKCRDFQFKVGETYEEPEASVCSKGFHFCTEPLDVLDYYNVGEDGNFAKFAKVESEGEISKEDDPKDSKVATTKIKIHSELNFSEFVKTSVDATIESVKPSFFTKGGKVTDKDEATNASSGYNAKNASSGNYAKNASSGYNATNASSGENATNASSGYNATNASSGENAKNASSGENAKNASSGYNAKNASSGNYATNASSGENAKNASSGYNAKNASSGNYATNASSGENAKNASSGNYAKNASSGNYAKNASSGIYGLIDIKGKDSVGVAAGRETEVSGVVGSWFGLTSYDKEGKPNGGKFFKIDGKKYKAGHKYKILNNKIIEVK